MPKRRNILKEVKVKLKPRIGKEGLSLGQLTLDDIEAVVDEASVRAINEDLDGLHKNISNDNIRNGLDPNKLRHSRIDNVKIGTAETPVQHTLGVKPYRYDVVLKQTHSEMISPGWYQVRDADSRNVYLAITINATVTNQVFINADVLVEG